MSSGYDTAFLVTQATDINTDPSCRRTMDPDIALSSSLGPDITLAPVVIEITQISMVQAVAKPSDTDTVFGG
ncbi:reticulocalbin-1-like protein [Cricetulus griseus]|uniref:Reticulocalbin-1-like protein n=1 Tax=Cricetulus griseus TaxID=10029 RepID=A0A061I124_CRIGR|nr:reticulocalbin-1-like protein [Cricetulus griseus]